MSPTTSNYRPLQRCKCRNDGGEKSLAARKLPAFGAGIRRQRRRKLPTASSSQPAKRESRQKRRVQTGKWYLLQSTRDISESTLISRVPSTLNLRCVLLVCHGFCLVWVWGLVGHEKCKLKVEGVDRSGGHDGVEEEEKRVAAGVLRGGGARTPKPPQPTGTD